MRSILIDSFRTVSQLGRPLHRMGVQAVHGPGPLDSAGRTDSKLGMATAAGVGVDTAANRADPHSGRCHPAAPAGEGGRGAGGARVPRVAAGRRQDYRFRSHPLPEPVRVHEDRREGEGVFPQRRHPLDHDSAGVCRNRSTQQLFG